MDRVVNFTILSDHDLVSQARAGSSQAFNELVLRYRKKAIVWAEQVTNDAHHAEDIVQESFIKAFLQLGSLEQLDRFVPWLQRIIRNQALMHVRRGGPFAKERPFSTFMDGDGELLPDEKQNPVDAAIRQENSELIHNLLQYLNPKEREVFEAYFIKQYSPQEIAAVCALSSTNVYTTLSRSKVKIQQLLFQTKLTQYLNERSKLKDSVSYRLLNEKAIYFEEIWDTYALSVLHAIQYEENKGYSMAAIMGLTGQAFRLQLHHKRLDWLGPAAFDWRNIFHRGLRNLGFLSRSIGEGQTIVQTNEVLMEAFSFVHKAIDQGRPVIIWGIEQPFFGMIHGYDDQARKFRITGLFEQTTISYEQLGRKWSADLFAICLGKPNVIAPSDALRGALQLIIDHAEGSERTTKPEYIQGIAAYETWIAAIQSNIEDAYAHAYNIWTTGNARSFAVQFLNELAEQADRYGEQGAIIGVHAKEAAKYYSFTAEAFAELRIWFPFPSGGNPTSTESITAGIALLEVAMDNERRGLECLKAMLQLLN